MSVTLNTEEGSLTFSENGVIFDEPIFDERFKTLDLYPAVSFEYEGDQILFSKTLEWIGVDKIKSETIEHEWDELSD